MRRKILATIGVLAMVMAGAMQCPAQAAPPSKPGVSDDGHQVPVFEKDKKTGKMRSSAQLLPPDPGNVYYWQGGVQNTTNGVGASAGMRLNQPYKHSHEYHTISEIAVIETNAGGGLDRDMVEIGFGKTLAGCGQIVNACLWGGHWIADGAGGSNWQGWNVGFTDYASSLNLGDVINSTETAGCTSGASARSERFSIRKNDTTGVWMLNVDLCYGDATAGEWIGHFDDANWTAAGQSFTGSTEFQVFSEVLTAYEPSTNVQKEGYPCSDSGTGYLASTNNGPYPAAGQRMADVTEPNVANSAIDMILFSESSDPAFDPAGAYAVADITSVNPPGNKRYFNTGGPGFSGTTGNSLPGVQGGC